MAAQRPKTGLSLYDNLADPEDATTTISSGPVSYLQNDGSIPEAVASPAAKKPLDPSLRFQPIRRPQAKPANKPKGFIPKAAIKPAAETTPVEAGGAASASAPPQVAVKTTLADWAATEEDEWRYGTGEKRQRGGRKKKKKKQDDQQMETNWDEIYDPEKPTNVEEYEKSDEKINEVKEWRALLYQHRRRKYDDSDLSDEDDERPAFSNQFAPPPSYNEFAPPPPSPPAAMVSDDKTGDDAFARRIAMSHDQFQQDSHKSSPPPPPEASVPPSHSDSATISRAPVRYTQPRDKHPTEDVEMEDQQLPETEYPDTDDKDKPRSTRPGQAGFAARLMSKYGWSQGTGLGADESGIINPLRVQVEKRRKKADADGGGWAEPGGRGKILGSQRKENDSKFGPMSEVIVLRNMLENMEDLDAEIENGLGQEIGEECGDKYGRVERLHIDRDHRQVFIKFTDQVSALRAVNELDGRIFNGNAIAPKFYSLEKFEKHKYV